MVTYLIVHGLDLLTADQVAEADVRIGRHLQEVKDGFTLWLRLPHAFVVVR